MRVKPMSNKRFVLAAAVSAALASASSQAADQSTLTPVVNAGQQTLQFDWPAIRVGTAEYEDGPTGVTVIHFPKRALGAVDVRGGGPGTVNTDYLRLGYDTPELDAVVFSGGSWYGLESITAVGTALKDDGVRSGDWTNLALSVGAIIYDLGDRRLNEIYPDKRLAQAALRADRPGIFPLGSHGAGRFAKTGGLFGCNAFSGQGAAFRQTGEVKIAAFVVVNALGVVTRRDGRVAACYGDTHWSKDLRATDLLASYPDSRKPGTTVPASNEGKRNTTVSLIVTNQKLNPAELQRLATHVHSSMSRAITPFATEFDGDVLYAVSTGELDPAKSPGLPNIDLDVEGAELMWDAILASVPAQPGFPHVPREVELSGSALQEYTGEYTFSQFARLRITTEHNKLFAQATGPRTVYGIGQSAPTELQALSPTDFTVVGRYPLVLHFEAPGKLVINPGDWQQMATK
ncbi:MAG: P1 family peptidase [Proteobacteria bacterium]|nr:P1 family peptidase [Pseudomonadota bacterium]